MQQPVVTGRPASAMSLMDAAKTCFQKSITISGRASRSEYWFFQLTYTLTLITLVVIDVMLGTPLMLLVIAFIPALFTVTIRRLHDIGKSGWMLLLMFIPLVNFILMIMWFIADAGQPGPNQYGEVPTNQLD